MIPTGNNQEKHKLDTKQMKNAIAATFAAMDQLSEFFDRLRES